MRIVFAGTPDFAVPCLRALADSSHSLCAVYTQPDRPSGRGRKLRVSPVKAASLELGLPVEQPQKLFGDSILARLRAYEPHVMVVVAYGLILSEEVLSIPRRGCVNVHASLLPRWRGAAPIQRAIEAGDRVTGVSIMQMDRGLDTGPVMKQKKTIIGARDTAGDLHDRLAHHGAELLLEVLSEMESGCATPRPQNPELATYAHKLGPGDAACNWRASATELERKIRAMNPWPGVRTEIAGTGIRLWDSAVVHKQAGRPGEILEAGGDGMVVACGRECLRVTELQRDGGKRLHVSDFLNGCRIRPGDRFCVGPWKSSEGQV